MARGARNGKVWPVAHAGPDKEAELLKRLLEGDSGAWRELVMSYSAVLMGVSARAFRVYRMEGTEQDHEDVVAAVWENLLEEDKRVVRRCLEQGNLTATLYVLTKHRAVDLIRKKGVLAAEELTEEMTEEMEVMAEEGDGERVSEEEVAGAMEKLTEKQRTLVRLFYLHQKSYKEIEALTGVGLNSIGPTIKRAVERLREILGG